MTTKALFRSVLRETDKSFNSGFLLLTTGKRYVFANSGNGFRTAKSLSEAMSSDIDFATLVVNATEMWKLEHEIEYQQIKEEENANTL